MVHFRDVLRGPPTSWVPPPVSAVNFGGCILLPLVVPFGIVFVLLSLRRPRCRCGLAYAGIASLIHQVVVSKSSGRCCVVALTMWVVGTVWGSISLVVVGEEVKREKWATTNIVARFCDTLDGPPIYWVLPCVFPPQFPRRAGMWLPTSLWKGEGRVRLSSVLRIPGC